MKYYRFTAFLLCLGFASTAAYAQKFTICHKKTHTITVGSQKAVAAHMRHGDTLGACPTPPPSPPPISATFPQDINGNPVLESTAFNAKVAALDVNTPDFPFNQGQATTIQVPVTSSPFCFSVAPVIGFTLKIRPIYVSKTITGLPKKFSFDPSTGEFCMPTCVAEIGHQILMDFEQLDSNGQVANSQAFDVNLYSPASIANPAAVVTADSSATIDVTSAVQPANTAKVFTPQTLEINGDAAAMVTGSTNPTVFIVPTSNQAILLDGQLQQSGVSVPADPASTPIQLLGCQPGQSTCCINSAGLTCTYGTANCFCQAVSSSCSRAQVIQQCAICTEGATLCNPVTTTSSACSCLATSNVKAPTSVVTETNTSTCINKYGADQLMVEFNGTCR